MLLLPLFIKPEVEEAKYNRVGFYAHLKELVILILYLVHIFCCKNIKKDLIKFILSYVGVWVINFT